MPPNPRDRFAFLCQMEWDELEPTDDPAVRFCSQCLKEVTHATTEGQLALFAAQGRCAMWEEGATMEVGVVRLRPPDLSPRDAPDTPGAGEGPASQT